MGGTPLSLRPVADWTDLTDGAGLRPGGVTGVEIGGRELVVWRDRQGRPCVMDARCPHQWSHLPSEGVVDGAELVCTAHFWRFGRDGAGWKLAVTGRRDRKGDVEVYPCREAGGRIEAQLPGATAEAGP